MPRHPMDNGRSDSFFPGRHSIDWSRSSTRSRRESTHNPLTTFQPRRRESQSLRATDRDSGFSARSNQPMMVTYGGNRADREHQSTRDRDGDGSRYRSSSRSRESDREHSSFRRYDSEDHRSDTSRYGAHSSSQNSSNARQNSFRGGAATRRWDMFPSMDSLTYSRQSSYTSDRARDRERTASQIDSVQRSSTTRRSDLTEGRWPSFRNSCEGRWPFSPGEY